MAGGARKALRRRSHRSARQSGAFGGKHRARTLAGCRLILRSATAVAMFARRSPRQTSRRQRHATIPQPTDPAAKSGSPFFRFAHRAALPENESYTMNAENHQRTDEIIMSVA